ncbi:MULTISPECIES: ABC transporter substrate-binding protein [unclassified Paenibacillus]|uniref:ABC transporter substrate-binding protein n=1 Tax=unclassified Paenibacillus TaxID=185978 RepID=UPI00277F461A|nr:MULTISPECIES: sugar ABC transporter substrate-binding protein [unclassified Paenibacillus]MDQ0900775.1 multiple sugar transport system substrate-binding protein [Paenibacillus sp. V4I7]MDQ0920717.1 multiple sugar transport system substrate-binding protein [Paenibacillus sp. V4I5]
MKKSMAMRVMLAKKLLLVVAVFSMLISCEQSTESAKSPELDKLFRPQGGQSKDTNAPKKVLRLWSFHTSKEFEFWQELGKQYQQLHPDIEIKVEYVSSDDYFTGERLLASFASGTGPDIFFVSSPMIKRLADVSMLMPLDSFFTPAMKEDFYPAALDSVTLYNNIYAVPIETELMGLFYNKSMFQKHEISPPKNWNEMMEAAQKLRSSRVSGLTIETFGGVYQNFSWLPFFWQTGADLISDDGKNLGLSHTKGEEMYNFFRGMVNQGLINMQPSRPATDIGILTNGETAMQVSGTWNIRMLETQYADQPIGVVPLPTPDGGNRLTIAGGWKIAVNSRSDYASEAAKFVMWAFSGDTSIPLRWCSDVKFAYSPRKSVMEAGSDYYRRGLREVFTNEIFGTERMEPQYPEEINRIFTQSLQSLLYSRLSGKEVAQSMEEKIDRFLSKIQK